MKSILFVIDELEVGGSQRQLLLLGKALVQLGHKVALAYFREDNAVLRPAFEAAGVEVLLVEKRRGVDPIFLAKLTKLFLRDRDRSVITFGYTANLWTRLAGAPSPVSCIRNFGYVPRKSMARVERLLAYRSRCIVANSQLTADTLIARGILPREKTRVIPNAVETSPPTPREEARARLRQIVAGDGPIVGTLARLVPEKDLATLVRAAKLVIEKVPDARFVVGGEGPLRTDLESLRKELGLEGRFFLPGTLTGREVIAGLDVAVLSSQSEGMPNFVLEAMAAGVPLVSTRAGAAPELLEEGRLGRLAAIGDSHALAEGIVAVLSDPEDSRTKARAAQEKTRAMSPTHIAERYLALFA